MNNLYGLDTNVLVYASFKKFPQHTLAARLIKLITENKIHAAVAWQNLTEYCAVVTNNKNIAQPLSFKEAWQQLSGLLQLGVKVVFPNNTTFAQTETLIKHKPAIKCQQVHDLFLAATFLSNGVKTIITHNKADFTDIKELTVLSTADVI